MPGLADDAERRRLLNYLEERFGIPSAVFRDFLLFERKKNWWFLKKSPFLETAFCLKISSFGMRAFNRIGDYIKPTTRMVQVFGKWATKARLELSDPLLRRLVAGEALAVDLSMENGYVILFHKDQALGLGLLIDGKVRSQLPVKELRFLKPKKTLTV